MKALTDTIIYALIVQYPSIFVKIFEPYLEISDKKTSISPRFIVKYIYKNAIDVVFALN